MVMEKRDYIQKAENLLNTSTYKKIPEDPTIKQKNKLVNILKRIKNEKGLMKTHTGNYTPQEQCHQSSMGCQRCISQVTL